MPIRQAVHLCGLKARASASILVFMVGVSACSIDGRPSPETASQVSQTETSPVSPVAQRFASPARQSASAPKEPIDLDITISAAADVNPDGRGRASPILVRFYELRAAALYDSADYFSLQANDRGVLGSDLLAREEFILRPGEVKHIQRKSDPDLNTIGVFAGYRDLAESEWRALRKVPPAPEAAWYRFLLPARRLHLQVDLRAKGIRVDSTP